MKKRTMFGLGVGVVGTLAAMASSQRPRWQRIRQVVAPELRSPMLAVPLPHASRRTLRFVRLLPIPATVPAGVHHEIRTATVPGREPVTVHVYEPVGRERPSGALYWIHGGGFVMGTPAMGHQFCSRVARELGALVISVDYRLAPEHPFPAPLEDTYTGLRWLHDHMEELSVDPVRIAVGGESAGGGLAASLAQLAQDRGEVPVCFQLLVYPMLDDRSVLRADHGGAGDFVWDARSNRLGWTCYLGRAPVADEAPAYAAPARRGNLAGLPKTWIGVGSIDLFHAEDVAYAERLLDAGVAVELLVIPGMYHGADGFPGVAKAPSMARFNQSKLDALRAAIG
ncbi:MAG: alpha/beta hydrolase [Acidimicrobiales bacterium]